MWGKNLLFRAVSGPIDKYEIFFYKNAHRCARGSPMCDFAHPCQVIFLELEVAFGSNIALGSDIMSQRIHIGKKSSPMCLWLTNVPLTYRCAWLSFFTIIFLELIFLFRFKSFYTGSIFHWGQM